MTAVNTFDEHEDGVALAACDCAATLMCKNRQGEGRAVYSMSLPPSIRTGRQKDSPYQTYTD